MGLFGNIKVHFFLWLRATALLVKMLWDVFITITNNFPLQFKFDGNSIILSSKCIKVITMKFCTWHNNCAFVACGKFCSNTIPYNEVTLKPIFHRIWITLEKSFMKWVPDWCYIIIGLGNGLIGAMRQQAISQTNVESNDMASQGQNVLKINIQINILPCDIIQCSELRLSSPETKILLAFKITLV